MLLIYHKMIFHIMSAIFLKTEMKKIQFLIVIFSSILSLNAVYAQKVYELSSESGNETDVLTILDDNPWNIQRSYLAFGPFSFKGYSVGNLSSASGPFVLNLDYLRLSAKKDQAFSANFLLYPIDANTIELSGADYIVLPFSIDINFRKSFFSKESAKKRRMNFFKGNTIYITKIPLRKGVKYYGRGGIQYNQYTDGRSLSVGENRATINSVKSGTVYVGISKMKMIHASYKSKTFGSQKGAKLGEFYLDLLYSPILVGRGTLFGDNGLIEEGSLNADLSTVPFGFRVGGSSRGIWSGWEKLGGKWSYEIGFQPSFEDHYFYVSLGYSILLMY